jgi:hypothetical protein
MGHDMATSSSRIHCLPLRSSVHCLPLRSADLLTLIRAEYREMPGLAVTLAQAARLWNVDRRQCFDALEALTDEGLLRRSRDMYVSTAVKAAR